jgi:hypothetical protein
MLAQTKISSLLQLKKLLEQDNDRGFIENIKANPKEALMGIMEEPTEDEYNKYEFKSLEELKEGMRHDPRVRDILMQDPQRFLDKVVKEAPQPEFRIYRLLVGSLCALVIMISLGMIIAWLTKNSRVAPASITAIGCMALGLLAGTFVSVPGRSMKSQDVHKTFNRRNRNI